MSNIDQLRQLKWQQPESGSTSEPRSGWRRLLGARWEMLAALVIAASAGVITIEVFPTILQATASPPSFVVCANAQDTNCVIDGDTIRWQNQTIRLEDIDAPEVRDYKCSSELALGTRATGRLRDLLNSGRVELVYTGGRDEDVYGRKLRLVTNGQSSLGEILVAEGLARRWDGARRGWCA